MWNKRKVQINNYQSKSSVIKIFTGYTHESIKKCLLPYLGLCSFSLPAVYPSFHMHDSTILGKACKIPTEGYCPGVPVQVNSKELTCQYKTGNLLHILLLHLVICSVLLLLLHVAPCYIMSIILCCQLHVFIKAEQERKILVRSIEFQQDRPHCNQSKSCST